MPGQPGNKNRLTHGMTGTSEHAAWSTMKQRCLNPRNKQYADYGGRGITVCKRWLRFENFLNDVGRKPSPIHQLERADNDSGYGPNNCYWATPKQQANNRRSRRDVGSMNVRSRLTESAVKQLLLEHSQGKSVSALSREHAVSRKLVRNIVQRKTWKHVIQE